ncbi:hypothetical protein [Pseudohalioglobus lutimaris]|uniref:hypothetical protein n=1 Tax=Pseudohalioglobus lutimaris TaxID=1737061 RepID=UPI0013FDFCE7|nr:hypothetical protein [Pseudohalioglobus lutimaris]
MSDENDPTGNILPPQVAPPAELLPEQAVPVIADVLAFLAAVLARAEDGDDEAN